MRPALVLFALAACAPAAPASTPGPSGNDGLSLDGVLDADPGARSTTPPSLKVFVVWDVAGAEGAAYKLGEGMATPTGFSLSLPSAPPGDVLVDGAVGVAHLIAVTPDTVLADGPLSPDDADTLAQSALGAAASTAVVYNGLGARRTVSVETCV